MVLSCRKIFIKLLCIFEDAEHPNVISVFLNKGSRLETTRSWNFLGLEGNGLIPSHSIWMKARLGEDTIIANIDTGKLLYVFQVY